MVLTEFLNFFSKFGPLFRGQAAQVVTRLLQQSDVTIISQTGEQFQAGLSLYTLYKDKGWGHTDCVSFSVMWQRGMSHALAFDAHFRQAGFVAMLNED
ncbi:MAG: nucleic acid-binding protein [Armatimonadota bacterium]|nr:nucleic acid-binding protein [Armatimonadota bacterium]